MSIDAQDQTLLTSVPLEDGDGSELVGSTVDGRYRLDGTIGRGGMGLVYRATHVKLRRLAAVKILHPSLAASADVRNRFEREALASGKIDHPNCVAVYDSGHLPDGSLYLAMELLEGEALADILQREGQITPARALHILAHLLRGLQHIHQSGLVHRDIKPENIFLIKQGDDDDFAKILDFGIAKPITGELSDDGVKLTQAGMAFGTPIYMAPEQALGNKLDGRADLYAAAVVAYEMLAGQPPFYSDDKLEVMSMHTAKPVPPMRHRLAKGAKPVPSSIEKLIVRGLTKKPGDRYADAGAFLAAVERALDTSDGGSTDVVFERPDTTGSQPLVTDSGSMKVLEDNSDEATSLHTGDIGAAIDEALSAPTPVPQRTATPVRGTQPRIPQTSLGPVHRPSQPAPFIERTRPPTPPPPLPGALIPASRNTPPPRGGVGLGLPYTGPAGQPIFGLTPEQRLAQANPTPAPPGVAVAQHTSGFEIAGAPPPAAVYQTGAASLKPRRWPLYAAGAGFAIVVGVIIAIATHPGGSTTPPEDGKPPAPQFARDAYAALETGDTPAAQKLLTDNKELTKTTPLAQLVQGLIYADSDLKNWPNALVSFRTALRGDPDLATDKKLRGNLKTMAASPDPGIVGDAFDVWLATNDPEAAEKAALAAIAPDNPTRRHAVKPAIDRHKAIVKVDWMLAYAADLQDLKTCDERKEALAKLHALGDRRAIPTIEQAVHQTRNTCLVNEAKATIGYLNGLPK